MNEAKLLTIMQMNDIHAYLNLYPEMSFEGEAFVTEMRHQITYIFIVLYIIELYISPHRVRALFL